MNTFIKNSLTGQPRFAGALAIISVLIVFSVFMDARSVRFLPLAGAGSAGISEAYDEKAVRPQIIGTPVPSAGFSGGGSTIPTQEPDSAAPLSGSSGISDAYDEKAVKPLIIGTPVPSPGFSGGGSTIPTQEPDSAAPLSGSFEKDVEVLPTETPEAPAPQASFSTSSGDEVIPTETAEAVQP